MPPGSHIAVGGESKPSGLPAGLTSEDSTGSVGSGGSIADLKRFWEGKSTTPAKGSARSSLAGTPTAQRSRSFGSEAAPLPGGKQDGQEVGSSPAPTGAPGDAGALMAAMPADAATQTTAVPEAVQGAAAGVSHETESEQVNPAPALQGPMPFGLAGVGDASTDGWDNVPSSSLNAVPACFNPSNEAGSPAAMVPAAGAAGEQQEQWRQEEVQPAPMQVPAAPGEAEGSDSSILEQLEGSSTPAGDLAADQLDEPTATAMQDEAPTVPQTYGGEGGKASPEAEAPWDVTANALPAADEWHEQGCTSSEAGPPLVPGTSAPLPSVETGGHQHEVAAVAEGAPPGELEGALAAGHAPMMGRKSSAALDAADAEEQGAWAQASSESLAEQSGEAAQHADSDATVHGSSEAAEHGSSEAAGGGEEQRGAEGTAQQEGSAAGFTAFGEDHPGVVAEVSGSPRGTLEEQGSLPNAAAAQASRQLSAELGDDGSDGDDFGEFAELSEATEAATEAAPGVISVAQPAVQQVSEPGAGASWDDEFADFGEFDAAPVPAPVSATPATLLPAQQAVDPTNLQRAESATAPVAAADQPAGLIDLPVPEFRAAVAALLASVQPLPQPSNHPATIPFTLTSLVAAYPQLGAATVKGQTAAAGDVAGGRLLHWRGSQSEARFLERLGLSSTRAGAGSKHLTSDAAHPGGPTPRPASDPASNPFSSEGKVRAGPHGTMDLSQLPVAEQGALGIAAAQVHGKIPAAPVGAAAPQLGDEVEVGFSSSGAAPQGEQPAAAASLDQDPFATAGPWQQQEPAVLAAAVPLAAAGALAAKPGPLARGAQQSPAHSTSQAAVPMPDDPFAAPAAPREASGTTEGPLAKGAAHLGAPPGQPAAPWDPFAASDQFVAPRPGPLQAAAQHLPAHSPAAADPFAVAEVPVVAAVPSSSAAASGLDWSGDPFQGPAGWGPTSNAPAWDTSMMDAGSWGVPAAAQTADPFAASLVPVVAASSAVGAAAAFSTVTARQQQGDESAWVEGSVPTRAQPASEPDWGETTTQGGPPAVLLSPVEPAGDALHEADDWGEDGWSDFAEAALPGPPSASMYPVPGSVAREAGDDVGGDTLVADQGGTGQGGSSSAGGVGEHRQSAAVDAILAQMPDLSFMLSPSLVRP
ncbi:hypothetical protein N2152v2_003659 [Parachlorella kessleri]